MMTRFGWTWYITVSMGMLGINMLRYAHDPAEVLQFTGAYLIVSSVGIPVVGYVSTFFTGKTGKKRSG